MILITGSSGYIGSEITNYLEQKNMKYIGIDNHVYSSSKNIINKKKHLKIDISNNKIGELIRKNKITTIIHCAALSYVLDAEKNKKKYIQNNVKKTKKFINICKDLNVKNFIFLSTSNVYSESLKTFSEKNLTNPINLYGKTKTIIEKYLYTLNFKNLIILRLFNIAGYTNNLKHSEKTIDKNLRIFPLIFKKIKKKKTISIYVKSKNNRFIYPKRDYLLINDLLNLIIKIIRKLNKLNKKEIYNVGMGINYSLNEILTLISKRLPTNMKKNLKLKYKKIDSKELISTLSDVKKTSKTFNWKPKNSIDEIISSCINNFSKI